MADTGVFNVDEDFFRAWLGHGDLLVLKGAADLVDDLSPLLGGDLGARHSSRA